MTLLQKTKFVRFPKNVTKTKTACGLKRLKKLIVGLRSKI